MQHVLLALVVPGSLMVQGFDWNTLGLGGSEEEHGAELRRYREADAQRSEQARQAQAHVSRQVESAGGAVRDRHALHEQARHEAHQQSRRGLEADDGRRASLSEHSTEIQHQHQLQSQKLRGSTARAVRQSGSEGSAAARVTTLSGPQDDRSITLRLHANAKKKKNKKARSQSEPQVVIHGAGWVPPGVGGGGVSVTSPAAGVLFINTQPPQRGSQDHDITDDDYTEITP